MLASTFYSTLQQSGLTTVARHARAGGVILCYHNIVPSDNRFGAPGLHLDVARFREQIEWLVQHFTVLSLSEYAERLARRRSLRRVVAITCDDAYQGVFDLAWPILREHRLPLTVFVPTGMVAGDGFWWDAPAVVDCTTPEERDRWLTEFKGDGARICRLIPGATDPLPAGHRLAQWSSIATAVAEGCELGVHARTHRNLTALTDAELEEELTDGRAVIAQRTGVATSSFAYPYGLYNRRVRDAVADAGFAVAVTTRFGLNSAGVDPFALKRVNVPATIGRAAFEAWMSGLRPLAGLSS